MLSDADLVWNRACFGKLEEFKCRGDRALVALLLFHNYTMNGGILHAVECLQPRELAAVRSAYRFYQFHAVAELILEIGSAVTWAAVPDTLEASIERRYSKAIPDDKALSDRFEKHFEAHPSDFAPLSEADRRNQWYP